MICLACGRRQKGEPNESCAACAAHFTTAGGIYGVNNVTQLLSAIEELREKTITVDELSARFAAFAEVWDGFAARWKLDKQPVPELFELSPPCQAVYEPPLTALEEAFAHLDDAFAAVEELEQPDDATLDQLADDVRQFFRGICYAAALLFKKLQNPKGDFQSLLHGFSDW